MIRFTYLDRNHPVIGIKDTDYLYETWDGTSDETLMKHKSFNLTHQITKLHPSRAFH